MQSGHILFPDKLFKEKKVATHLIEPHPFFDIKSVLMIWLFSFILCDLDC